MIFAAILVVVIVLAVRRFRARAKATPTYVNPETWHADTYAPASEGWRPFPSGGQYTVNTPLPTRPKLRLVK